MGGGADVDKSVIDYKTGIGSFDREDSLDPGPVVRSPHHKRSAGLGDRALGIIAEIRDLRHLRRYPQSMSAVEFETSGGPIDAGIGENREEVFARRSQIADDTGAFVDGHQQSVTRRVDDLDAAMPLKIDTPWNPVRHFVGTLPVSDPPATLTRTGVYVTTHDAGLWAPLRLVVAWR